MKPTTTVLIGLTSAAVVITGAVAAGAVPTPGDPARTAPPAVAELDEKAGEHLAFTREEERLARDLYTALDDHHDGLAPFTMIKNAEQRHFDAVGHALDLHGLDDPSEAAAAGSYADARLQELYDDWLARGLTSEVEAFAVGVELETADIAGLEEMIDTVDNEQVDRLLGNLLRGSEHHLQAFTMAAAGELPAGPRTDNGWGMRGPGSRGPAQGQGQRGMDDWQGRQGGPGAGMRDGSRDCPFLEDSDSVEDQGTAD